MEMTGWAHFTMWTDHSLKTKKNTQKNVAIFPKNTLEPTCLKERKSLITCTVFPYLINSYNNSTVLTSMHTKVLYPCFTHTIDNSIEIAFSFQIHLVKLLAY